MHDAEQKNATKEKKRLKSANVRVSAKHKHHMLINSFIYTLL